MDKQELRLLINYDFRSKLSAQQCHDRLHAAYPDIAISYETVRSWFARFRSGDESLQDRHRSGRPATACTTDNIDAVRELVMEDRRISYNRLQAQLGIGRSAIQSILHEHLQMKKIQAKFVPHQLTARQREARVDFSQMMLRTFANGNSPMVWDIVTGDETWIRQRDPRSRRQSAVWCFDDESPETQVAATSWVGKKMVATFFCKAGLVATVQLPGQQSVNSQWYSQTCLPAVFDAWRARRPRDGLQHLRLHHDNAPAHSAAVTTDFIFDNGVRLLPHPPYSPDLAPADFFLFGLVKEKLRGRDFGCPDDAVFAYEEELGRISPNTWRSAFDNWFQRCRMCINVNGNYVD